VVPDLWRIPDALAHIRTMLAEHPERGTLTRFLPPIAPTFVAGLELAREGALRLEQGEDFAIVRIAVGVERYAEA
jgi:segregation and condensation protein A